MNRRNLSPNVADRRRTTSARPIITSDTLGATSNAYVPTTIYAVNSPIQCGTFVLPRQFDTLSITGTRPSYEPPNAKSQNNTGLTSLSDPVLKLSHQQVSAMSPKKHLTSSGKFEQATPSQATQLVSPTKLSPTSHEGPPRFRFDVRSDPLYSHVADTFGQIETDGTRRRKDLKAFRETGLTGIYLTDYIVDVGVPMEQVSAGSTTTSHSNSPFGINVLLDEKELEDAADISSKDGGYCKFFGRGREIVFGPQSLTNVHRDFMITGVPNLLGEMNGGFIEYDALSTAQIPSAHTKTTDSCTYRCVRGTVVGYYDINTQDQNKRAPQSLRSLLNDPLSGRVVLWRPRGQKHCIPLDLTRCRPIQCLRCQLCQGVVPLDEARYHMIDYHGATGQSPMKQYAMSKDESPSHLIQKEIL